ncbi:MULTISPECIES: MarR family winged helix-turn-helix transcriptional regulator [unclassified Arthrobacter]|uniref:MarR family winged helix-turn-helix transcriptional regulator n=1 Tax=unclassified Arthrobacter TaxID=235627 RepID=UPI0024E02078|nr:MULTISPECIES: MarR family winged helix-turn-helix transcriptional regulator [unclassified Arthrobacter]MCC9144453.1 MarR family winged helix-turn-helix transcriptional regulator [Arthrobacter sp. zg-Y919]MDK1275679.1 MarR family winged helix-turn-helix transcriptional regulator [Arthrobacter sp. zg.Y919]WIB02953.1 MarR family winged helix-turn-helix transcriptional regulator [Arthrobacter sp. zg-Y919]
MTAPVAGDAGDGTFESSVLEVEREFSVTLAAARRIFKDCATAVHPALQPLGFSVLMTLYRTGECQQGAVAEALQVDKALLSRTVTQLETLGLAARRADPSDGRAQLLDLTPEGRVRFEGVHSAKRSRLREQLGSWTPAELRNLSKLLNKLNERD